ncbi:zinc finger protein 728 isoform X3 [Pieris rapae]|uniref:zinc finger protein 728 isoform X3 n=1 Tax=Pieris rapae TaxID=64459 RepID=UPI001E27C2E3|nr:zinc finger protein 728 isoform X3 [Pieris rapae]
MEGKVWRPGPTVCRCCLSEGCYKDISTEYFWMGKKEVYADMLSDTFDLSIQYAPTGGPNSQSRLICEPCISRLRDATDFRRQIKECEQTFMEYLNPSTTVDIEIPVELPEKEHKIVSVKVEKPLSDDDDFGDTELLDDDDLDDEPLMNLASKVPKKESVDVTDLIDNAKAEKRKSTTKAKAAPKKAKVKEAKPSVSKAKPEKKKKGKDTKAPAKRITPLFQVAYDRSLCKPLGTLFDFNKIRVKNVTSAPITSRSPSPVSMDRSPGQYREIQESIVKETPRPIKKSDKRQNALLVFEFSTAYPFIYGNNKFKCFICSQPFLDITLLRDHMASAHTFASLKRLLNNKKECVLKVEVTDLACKICSAPLNDLVELKDHLKSIHQKPIDAEINDNMIPFKLELQRFDCVICRQGFIKLRPLVIHMNVHFNNYSCEICGTGFMTLRLLKTHLEVHERGSYPCDRCDKVFSTSHKRSIHIRGVHLKQYPRRCPMCPERFNSNYRRTIHLQDVHQQSTRVHKCETCGRAFHLKYHLICHNRSVHLQERNHQCKVCTQRFCNKETLKRHMVIHTGEKNYKCDFCGLAFLRRKNLKDHLRSHDVV